MHELKAALLDALGLKDLPRTGWVRAGVEGPESVAAHSWGLSLLVLTFLPAHLDRDRALAYATVHDLGEVFAGDITPHDGLSKAEKVARERAAMDRLSALPAPIRALWDAYEAQADPEARFVRQLDRLDMALQGARYAQRHGLDLREFLQSARKAIHAPELKPLLDLLEADYGSEAR